MKEDSELNASSLYSLSQGEEDGEGRNGRERRVPPLLTYNYRRFLTYYSKERWILQTTNSL